MAKLLFFLVTGKATGKALAFLYDLGTPSVSGPVGQHPRQLATKPASSSSPFKAKGPFADLAPWHIFCHPEVLPD